MDFIEGPLKSQGHSVILVVVDRLSKLYVQFVALAHPYTVASVVQIFVKEIARLHGMPTLILSDRNQIFLNQFWKEFF